MTEHRVPADTLAALSIPSGGFATGTVRYGGGALSLGGSPDVFVLDLDDQAEGPAPTGTAVGRHRAGAARARHRAGTPTPPRHVTDPEADVEILEFGAASTPASTLNPAAA